MPAAAPAVEKQQGLNQVMINKVQKMIEGKQRDVMGTITRLLEEGKAAQDFIAPIGTGRRNSGRKPVISFHAADRVQMAMPEGDFNLHGNAISQISEKNGCTGQIPQGIVRWGHMAETTVRHNTQ